MSAFEETKALMDDVIHIVSGILMGIGAGIILTTLYLVFLR